MAKPKLLPPRVALRQIIEQINAILRESAKRQYIDSGDAVNLFYNIRNTARRTLRGPKKPPGKRPRVRQR